MASFEEHINQVKNNIHFLSEINSKVARCFDWQVTVCFYTALHLVNAHLSKFGLQYRKHSEVNYVLNSYNRTLLQHQYQPANPQSKIALPIPTA